MTEEFVKKLAQETIKSNAHFLQLKQKIAGELNVEIPTNVKLLTLYRKLEKHKKIKPHYYFKKLLKKRPVRSLSGVAVVAVLTKPWSCPGPCIFCPLEQGVPKSYVSGEPAVERAKLLKYSPYNQVKKRIEVLEKTGHPTDKIELIVIGGTWSSLPKQYQTWFIKKCFDAANNSNSKNLEQAQKRNEKVKHRIIGLTLETRPDHISKKEILRMRKLGCTRVEIGVQAIDDTILKKNTRGHGVKEIIRATKLLKNAGFKICYHMMPGLLGSSPQKDLKMFKKLFTEPDYQPDMLKIYPCAVIKGSKLYNLWKQKKYKPYSDTQLTNLLIKMKSIIPPYVRINRLIRDIPAWQIQGGSEISNLREVVQKKMRKQHKSCKCIRCREIKDLRFKPSPTSVGRPGISNFRFQKLEYDASDGKEIFLSYEDKGQNKLAAFLRLRLPEDKVEIPVLNNAAIIREVHTYGQLVPISKSDKKAAQHIGLGKKLIKQAEKIGKSAGYKKIAVISGIGTHEYYRKLGYRLQNTYMIKSLKHENMKT